MKAIGFIDLYLSEWHANNYPEFIKRANAELNTDFEVKYAFAEKDISPVDGRTTDEWCRTFGVTKCRSIEELCEKSDYILILAPSNPEMHLKYAEIALRYGKNTYIDKTFAPNLETALKIFDTAEGHSTAFFSSSALRYADELSPYIGKCDTATVLGSGRSVEEYIIHQTEMLVRLMGTGAVRVRAERAEDQFNFRIEYKDGRKASVLFSDTCGIPAAIIPHTKEKSSEYIAVSSDYFGGLMKDILRFYQTGVPSFDMRETLEVMSVREALVNAKECTDEWVRVSPVSR